VFYGELGKMFENIWQINLTNHSKMDGLQPLLSRALQESNLSHDIK